MSWINVAIGGSNAFSAISSGRNAQGLGNMQGEVADYQAGVERESSLKLASVIRRAGREQVGRASAAAAAAGVKVGDGSSGEVERQINLDVENDAFQAILEGSRRGRALKLEGVYARTQGSLARSAANVQAVNALAQGAYQGHVNWRNRAPQPAYSYNNDERGLQFSQSGADIRGRR
ncbi:MAG: hypothetical protein ACRC1H_11760 [Caldilineaceae bacterium]